ncbi:hypothetical protein M413DRAFT_440319 [Hebeloma cylindrosporum]|uniref:F-box domain-containing protein n=1 Tax=Hebeloma cylindrosporum TaxID=76867 RepID=A0A0C2YA83_HEBCY|nr:hypothetical protein M413DRAFT_440319 [Hebeloma cylindrosporum h7]
MDPQYLPCVASISPNHPQRTWRRQACLAFLPMPSDGPPPRAYTLNYETFMLIMFSILADSDFWPSEPWDLRAIALRRASQICRHWRHFSIGHGSLWNGNILSASLLSSPEWVQELIRRLNGEDIDVFIPGRANPQNILTLLEHLPRIRSLEMYIQTPEAWQALEFAVQAKPAPILQRFSVSTRFEKRRRFFRRVAPRNIFWGQAPNLQQLRLHNTPIDFSGQVFGGLTELVLDAMPFEPITYVLDSLRHMGGLRKLCITRPQDNATSYTNVTPPVHSPTLPLPHLIELQISCPIADCATLLALLIPNKACSMAITVGNGNLGKQFRSILLRIKKILQGWSCEPLTGYQSLRFGTTYVDYMIQGPETISQEHPYINLAVSWPRDSRYLENLFTLLPPVTRAFSRCESLPDTLKLYVDEDIFTDPQQDLHIRLRHPLSEWLLSMNEDNIHAVEFEGNYAFLLYQPLLKAPKSTLKQDEDSYDGEEEEEEVPLPFIGDVKLESVNLDHRSLSKLGRLVKSRRNLESPIIYLEFVQCGNVHPETLAEFDVGLITVDGVVVNDVDNPDVDMDGWDSDYTVQTPSDEE